MDAADFRELYAYNAWANRRMLDSCTALTPDEFLRDLKSSFPSVRDTLAHIYGGEFVWLERWNGRSPVVLPAASDFLDLESLRAGLTKIDEALIAFISTLGPKAVLRNIEYKMLNGSAASGPIAPMLHHLVNHGTYHRGQVTMMLRQMGAKVIPTDLIIYHRELAARASA